MHVIGSHLKKRRKQIWNLSKAIYRLGFLYAVLTVDIMQFKCQVFLLLATGFV